MAVDPISLEVFKSLFISVSEEMGVALQRTSYSPNIKERLDFSCAIFDGAGDLVANAPHIPVHLGSMSESVKSIVRQRTGTINPGDVFVLNAPYNGGTHLPDVTVITPVFDASGTILFYVASRGHHAEIGGIVPPGHGLTDAMPLHDVASYTDIRHAVRRKTKRHPSCAEQNQVNTAEQQRTSPNNNCWCAQNASAVGSCFFRRRSNRY